MNLLLLGVLGNSSVVLGNGLLLSLSPPLLEGSEVSLPLETQGGNKTLLCYCQQITAQIASGESYSPGSWGP